MRGKRAILEMALQENAGADAIPILPEDVPVEMPNLPDYLVVNMHQQFRAFGDPVRERILRIIQNQPATAKQIADNLNVPPGTIGHHLQVLEEAGLAQIVARRLIRGIVAKYYTRTARIFKFAFPSEVQGEQVYSSDILSLAHDELMESIKTMSEETASVHCSFPHVRLSAERVKVYQERLATLLDDLLAEAPDPQGQVYGLVLAMFLAPDYAQKTTTSPVADTSSETAE